MGTHLVLVNNQPQRAPGPQHRKASKLLIPPADAKVSNSSSPDQARDWRSYLLLPTLLSSTVSGKMENNQFKNIIYQAISFFNHLRSFLVVLFHSEGQFSEPN